jgi:GR25 family glycosyltransferase involved in LPS biosynthesis
MRYFVINLEKDIKKFNSLDIKMKKLDINIERIPGVDISKFSSLDLLGKTTTFMNDYGTNGMIGCFLAHRSAWEKVYSEKLEYAIILEDDIEVKDNIKDIVKEILSNNYDFDILLLSYSSGCKPPIDYNIVDKCSKLLLSELQTFKYIDNKVLKPEFFTGNQMYMVSYKGVEKLLNEFKEVNGHVDLSIANNNNIKKLALIDKACFHIGEKTSNNVSKSNYIIDKLFLSNYYIYDINMEWALNMPFLKIYKKNITPRFLIAISLSIIIIILYIYKNNYSIKNTLIYLFILVLILCL